MSNNEILKQLFKKYKLNYDQDNPDSKENDVYVHKHYKIITRQGIQKIEQVSGITCKFEVIRAEEDHFYLKATGQLGEKTYETFASASSRTSKNEYWPEMAEKRARSRIVLTLAGLYELGVFGEDEADAFSDVVKANRQGFNKAVYKGNA